MTKKKQQKRRVRERMAKTGETYQSAQRAVVAQTPAAAAPEVAAVVEAPERWGLHVFNRDIALPERPFVIGRTQSSALWIEHPLMSRKHATLHATADGLTVEDHDSRNGTFHNGARVKEGATLAVGDRLKVASTEMTVIRTRAPVDEGTLFAPVAPITPVTPPKPVLAGPGAVTIIEVPGAARVPELAARSSLVSPPAVDSVLAGRYRLTRMTAATISGVDRGGARSPFVLYEATHVVFGAPVMIKLLPRNLAHERPQLRAWVAREARALQKASHPQVQRVFDIVETDAGDVFLVLDEVPKQTLPELIAEEGPSEALAIEIGLQLAEILARVHDGGVVHRDLRNDIVHVERTHRIRLTSFSLALIASEPRLTVAGTSFGQTAWSSPELRRGEEGDARSDLYAAGVMLFVLATGFMPTAEPIASPLGSICAKLLEPNPADRYADAKALRQALGRLR